MSGGFQMPSAPGYQAAPPYPPMEQQGYQPSPYPPGEQQGYQPSPYPPMEQQGYQPSPYPPVDQQPGSHMMQPMEASGAQFAEPVMGSEGDAWMGPVHEQMVPLNCPPGNNIVLTRVDVTGEFRVGVSDHDRPAHHQAKEGDVGGHNCSDGRWV